MLTSQSILASRTHEFFPREAHGPASAYREMSTRDTVRSACELLGLDPLHIANEDHFLASVIDMLVGDPLSRIC